MDYHGLAQLPFEMVKLGARKRRHSRKELTSNKMNLKRKKREEERVKNRIDLSEFQ